MGLFSKFYIISKKEHKLSQYCKCINLGYKTQQYKIVMCEFHLSNQLDLTKLDAGIVIFGMLVINILGFLTWESHVKTHVFSNIITIVLYFKSSWFLSLRFSLKNQDLYLSELSSKFVQHVISMDRLINIFDP